jgi:amino acid transporter
MDSGKVLSLAGPWGAILVFAIVGSVVTLVMRCITEMIGHWPISNALVEFVSSFVDDDLGMIIGIAHW